MWKFKNIKYNVKSIWRKLENEEQFVKRTNFLYFQLLSGTSTCYIVFETFTEWLQRVPLECFITSMHELWLYELMTKLFSLQHCNYGCDIKMNQNLAEFIQNMIRKIKLRKNHNYAKLKKRDNTKLRRINGSRKYCYAFSNQIDQMWLTLEAQQCEMYEKGQMFNELTAFSMNEAKSGKTQLNKNRLR